MKVLFVCTGNTCRSPMAHYYLASKKLPDVQVLSRGIFAMEEAANEKSISVMKEIGIDLKDHISSPLIKEDLSADKIFCMTDSHRETLLCYGVNKANIFVLDDGIDDPFGLDIDTYRDCRNQITAAIDKLIEQGFFGRPQITPLEKDDLESIVKLEQICFSEPWSANAILESLNTDTVFFVAKSNNNVLGYIGIKPVLDEGYITNIAVFPEYRRMSIASKILTRIDEFAKEKGLSFVTLEVREKNVAAISLYRKFGYKNEGVRKNFYRNPTENAIIMTKRYVNK